MSVQFHPDGKTIVSGGYSGTLKFWDAASLELKATMENAHDVYMMNVVYNSAGDKIVSGGEDDNTIKVWDAASLELRAEKQSAHSDGVLSVAFSPNGKTIVSGSADKSLKVWAPSIRTTNRTVALSAPHSATTPNSQWSFRSTTTQARSSARMRTATSSQWS